MAGYAYAALTSLEKQGYQLRADSPDGAVFEKVDSPSRTLVFRFAAEAGKHLIEELDTTQFPEEECFPLLAAYDTSMQELGARLVGREITLRHSTGVGADAGSSAARVQERRG